MTKDFVVLAYACSLMPVAVLQLWTAITANGAVHPIIKRGQVSQFAHLALLFGYLVFEIRHPWYVNAMLFAGLAHAVLGTQMLLFWGRTWKR